MSNTWNKLKKLLGFGPECQNGGTKLLTGDCNCRQYYTGKLCENIVCLNNGTRVKPNSCQCFDPEHIHGLHCELLNCENGGEDTGLGYCKCLDNWYDGRFCENYSSPWGFIFGGVGAAILLLVVICVFCRLRFCSSVPLDRRVSERRRQRRARRQAAAANPDPNNARRGRGQYTTPPVWPPWPRNSALEELNSQEEPPPYVPKPDEPPPSYDEVITEQHRFPSVIQVLSAQTPPNDNDNNAVS